MIMVLFIDSFPMLYDDINKNSNRKKFQLLSTRNSSYRTICQYNQYSFLIAKVICFYRAGGIELYALEGKIKVDNTIEARLARIFDQMLPEIRQKLFRLNQTKNSID